MNPPHQNGSKDKNTKRSRDPPRETCQKDCLGKTHVTDLSEIPSSSFKDLKWQQNISKRPILCLYSRLVAQRVDKVAWDHYLPNLNTRFLTSFNLPVDYDGSGFLKKNDNSGLSCLSLMTKIVFTLRKKCGVWGNKKFQFSCISISVSLNNVWRFPCLASSEMSHIV